MSKEHREPRVLATYQSQTGNTNKVAEAIFDSIPERRARKLLWRIRKFTNLATIDRKGE